MAEEDRIGLADFLTDLRAELSEAQSRAAGDSLKLGVEEISLTLEVAYTLTKAGEASAGVKAKFWVFAEAEAGVKGSLSSERARTQQLTLTLKPRVEQVVIDRAGAPDDGHPGCRRRGKLSPPVRNSRPCQPLADPDIGTYQNLGGQ